MHNLTAVVAAGGSCATIAQRRIGADLVPEDVEVGAVRVSVTGWEGWVLEGLQVRELLLPQNFDKREVPARRYR